MDLRDRLSIERPILQAGLGGGVAGSELAIAVSNAGGLGTVGFAPPQQFEREIERTKRAVQGKPYAANLLVPFSRRAHVRACLIHKVPIVTLFFGFDAAIIRELKEAGTYVVYQIGTEEEAERVVSAGVDALIVQGVEAGGHRPDDVVRDRLAVGMDARLLEVTAAYAGECVSEITDLLPAAKAVDELAKGFS